MESKIPYKKDLTFISQEEENRLLKEAEYESYKKYIEYIDKNIAVEISSHIQAYAERYIVYDIMGDIKCYTGYKPLQKKLLEYAQQSLTDKGYANYLVKTDGLSKKLVILLDDNSKTDVEKEIKRIKRFNLKWSLILWGILLSMIIFFGFMLFIGKIK